MNSIPNDILVQYEDILKKKKVGVSFRGVYKKWLCYFLDFCNKYSIVGSKGEQVRLFIEKLQAKKQTADQQKQAAHAVSGTLFPKCTNYFWPFYTLNLT